MPPHGGQHPGLANRGDVAVDSLRSNKGVASSENAIPDQPLHDRAASTSGMNINSRQSVPDFCSPAKMHSVAVGGLPLKAVGNLPGEAERKCVNALDCLCKSVHAFNARSRKPTHSVCFHTSTMTVFTMTVFRGNAGLQSHISLRAQHGLNAFIGSNALFTQLKQLKPAVPTSEGVAAGAPILALPGRPILMEGTSLHPMAAHPAVVRPTLTKHHLQLPPALLSALMPPMAHQQHKAPGSGSQSSQLPQPVLQQPTSVRAETAGTVDSACRWQAAMPMVGSFSGLVAPIGGLGMASSVPSGAFPRLALPKQQAAATKRSLFAVLPLHSYQAAKDNGTTS